MQEEYTFAHNKSPVADLGEGPGGPAPLILGEKKNEMTKGRKAGWASKIEPPPLP